MTLSPEIKKYIALIKKQVVRDYNGMYREPGPVLKHPFIVPGSDAYANQLWDWDSWFSNVALRQILVDIGNADEINRAQKYERGCILNFLDACSFEGWMPICIDAAIPIEEWKPKDPMATNLHKPCLAQHAAFLVREDGGDAEWLREGIYPLQRYINFYLNHYRHEATGLLYWYDDRAIGVDNDPSTFGRPVRSSGSIYLNCLMYRELLALVYLLKQLNMGELAERYTKDAVGLKQSIREHCWDERDGFYYSVDLNLVPVDHSEWLHRGGPRTWPCLIQRISVWSGFLAMWAEISSVEESKRMVEEHLKNEKSFNAPFGVRTLGKCEKMYDLRASGNPSSWLGPIWGISNYLVFRGLVRSGFKAEALELAEKTIHLFGRDFERFGGLHEYYLPGNGEPVLNRGFQNWNYLVLNMIAWLEGKKSVEEF